LRFLIAVGTGSVPLFLSVRGRGPGTDQERSNPRLEPTLPKFTSATKEESHGEEEKGQEEEQVSPENTGVRLVLGQRR
jgi:hypothetical protein